MKNNAMFEKKFHGLFYIKLGILLFFAIWFSIACITNVFDFLNSLFKLENWHFRSDNYVALAKVLLIYNTPTWFLNILFSLDILAQAISAILFIISFISFFRSKKINSTINLAFSLSMALWAIFIIMEEIFIAYSFEGTHVQLLGFELISLIAMHFLPHTPERNY